jgi:DNA invertase Pin-like site-specific DNA recombinase
MNLAAVHPKITPTHLSRRAVVYLRQSSDQQVRQNKESQNLQYALQERARHLGWRNVEVIDTDLGFSASVGAGRREGFEQLIAAVAMGQVGIILSREASRLSRTDKDWCRLLEVCSLFDTLLGDAEQVYDLKLMDDQLVLGIKGTLSVVELNVLKLRLVQGMEAKARRGELFKRIPPGFTRDGDDKVAMDPDQRVQEAIGLLFRKFRETRSIRQTFLWFQGEGVELPVNRLARGPQRIQWRVPTHSFVANALRNPFYAGAYFYGRRQTEKVLVDGTVRRRSGPIRPPEQCKVFLWNHHPGYIDRQTFEENLRIMRGNNMTLQSDETVAPIRAGHGWLTGMLRCGRCGRKLHVRYWGKSGTSARYLCVGQYHAGGKYCIAFGGAKADQAFGRELVRALSPLGTRASLEAIQRRRTGDQERVAAIRRQKEQVEFEAQRAFEQYDQVDPRNRLVAEELERRWDQKIEQVKRLEADLARADQQDRPLTEAERQKIIDLGERFAGVWESPDCPVTLKKRIIRTVIEEVVVSLDETKQRLEFIIHWKGGCHTRFEMDKPRSSVGRKTSMEDLDVIRAMAVRYGDDQIAQVLNKLGRRTATGKRWNRIRVSTTRRKYAIDGQGRGISDPQILSLSGAAKYCGVSDTTIKRLVQMGLLHKSQLLPWAPWEIRRSDLDAEPVRTTLENLRQTGKLKLQGGRSVGQTLIFAGPQ